MADTCICPPTNNLGCTGLGNVNMTQPGCQILPNGDRAENPYYDAEANITYISYELSSSCDGNSIEEFLLLVCENIPLGDIIEVDQRLDVCPDFVSVPFDYNNTGGQPAPPGFRFLRIIVGDTIMPGSGATFRILAAGNYPYENPGTALNSFAIITPSSLILLRAPAGCLFLGCPAVPRLTLVKSCTSVIDDNMANLIYRVTVGNTGDTTLDNVQYSDVVSYNGTAIGIGSITVTPPTISVDTTVSGRIRLTGDLGTIINGEAAEIDYVVPITSIATAGTYTFSNLATASSGDIQGSAQCMVTIEAVELLTNNCCTVNPDGTASFTFSITNVQNSPLTSVAITDLITIPNNVTVRFSSFGGCQAVFVDDGTTVPLDTPITSRQIRLTCTADISMDATMNYVINFTIISTSSFVNNPAVLSNTLETVVLQDPDSQILINVSPLPNEVDIDVSGILSCDTSESTGEEGTQCVNAHLQLV